MQPIKSWITRHQFALFVATAYLISWAMMLTPQGGLIPQGPMIAAFLILGLVSGRPGVSGLWREMTRWRVGWHWYLIAPGFLLAAHLGALALNLALGAQVVGASAFQSLPAFLGVLVPLVFLGGQWEEPGWLGYALKRTQERFPSAPLGAALATGAIRMAWHTPLLLTGKIPWYDFLFFSLALQFILTWLYRRTGGSVLIAMLAHLASNVLFASLIPLFAGADRERYLMLMVGVECLIALGLLVATRGRLGQPERPIPAPSMPADLSMKSKGAV